MTTPWLPITSCFFFQAEDGIRDLYVMEFRRVLFRSGLLADYPETDATAQALSAFAKAYADRNEPEGATLALATLARYHPDGPLGTDARHRLGPATPYLDGVDPLPLLVGRIEEMRLQADRQQVPRTVSAYPEIGGSGGSPY